MLDTTSNHNEAGRDEATGAGGEDPLVLVGEVSAPFGILGQVKMRALMEKIDSLTRLPAVTVRLADGSEERLRIARIRPHGGGLLATITGIADRNAAERLRGALLLIRQSELPPLDDDSYYESDLIGLRVSTESGRDLGTIEAVHFYPANDVYETAEALIPAVGEIVLKVNVAGGTMLVSDIPGLRKDE
jgi:16S rRNA processing protein RimM